MTVWLLDSNVIMGYLNQDATQGFSHQFEQALLEGVAVSVITTIEILGWRGHDEISRASAEKLLSCMDEITLSPSVVQRTILLRTRYAIKLPDAVIAATALTCNLKLLTRNTVDFDHIVGLTVVNPFVTMS